jgi:hypothetical protein
MILKCWAFIIMGIVLFFSVIYSFFSLKIASKKPKKKGDTRSISDRVYKAFEFFITVSVAIIAGLGFLKFSIFRICPISVKESMFVLALLHTVAYLFVLVAVTAHLGSSFERWDPIEMNDWWRWLEPWVIFFSYIINLGIWIEITRWIR